MDSGGQEGDIEMPISPVNYGHIHESSKSKMMSEGDGTASVHHQEIRTTDQPMAMKKTVKYRECLKNHAVGIGGHAVDGCGEFMASGDEGTLEALKCAACNCHRNFHRREADGDQPQCYYCTNSGKDISRKVLVNLPPRDGSGAMPLGLPSSSVDANKARQNVQMIMALGNNNNQRHSSGHLQNEDHDHVDTFGQSGIIATMSMQQPGIVKKRFRTKFTQEQKDKMSAFAEKLGWKIQKDDDAAVQQFCMDAGVKRHVLKVWMHNNRRSNLGKNAHQN